MFVMFLRSFFVLGVEKLGNSWRGCGGKSFYLIILFLRWEILKYGLLVGMI